MEIWAIYDLRFGERTPLACFFRRPAENFVQPALVCLVEASGVTPDATRGTRVPPFLITASIKIFVGLFNLSFLATAGVSQRNSWASWFNFTSVLPPTRQV